MLTRSLALIVAALMLTLPGVAPSQNESLLTGDLVVRPSDILVSVIAVPPFSATEGSEALETGLFSRVIERNLEIAGWFAPIEERQLAVRQDVLDRAAEAIDFPEWNRLGADYLVRGTYTKHGERLEVVVEVFDVAVGRPVLGRRYRRTTGEELALAHQIADEIVESVTGERGIAQAQILFITQTRGGRELALMNTDGSERTLLTQDNATVMAACWGLNNTEVYFTTTRDYNPDLCGMFLDRSQTWYLSRLPGLNLSPTWNARNQRIALTLSRDGNSEIYTMNRRGEQLQRLTYNRSIDSSPVWTPDGRRILFTSDRQGGRPQIWSMDEDGRGQMPFTGRRGYRYNDGASVSPDGRRVAFTAKVDGQFDIFVMDIDGSDDSWVRLTDSEADDEDPTWMWDGQHIVFSSERSGQRQIHIMNADGSNVHQITTRGVNMSPLAEPPPPGD